MVLLLFPAVVSAQTVNSSLPASAGVPQAPASTATVSTALAPKIYFPYPKFDFHNVDEGPDITHLFHFRNRGKSTLVISDVHTSCGCTAAVVQPEDKKQILPGEPGVIKVTYHTQGRPGHATKIITVTTNDPVNPSFQLQLDMTVVRDVDVQPERVYFYGLKKGTSQTNQVKILGKPHARLNILSAAAAKGNVTVVLKPFVDTQEHRYGATLDITVPDSLPIGNFDDTINVKTDNPKKTDLQISVQGEVVGRVQFNPKSLYFASHQEQPVYVQFTVAPSQGLNPPPRFAIRSISSLKNLIKPSVKKTTAPDGTDSYSIQVYCVKNLPANSDGQDELDVITNDVEQPTIKIPVTIAKP